METLVVDAMVMAEEVAEVVKETVVDEAVNEMVEGGGANAMQLLLEVAPSQQVRAPSADQSSNMT